MPLYFRKKRYRLKKGRLLYLLAICSFLLLLFFTARFLGTLHELQDRSDWAKDLPQAKDGPWHLLLYSRGDNDKALLINNMYVLSFQPDKQQIHAIEIPTNTLLETKSQEVIPLAKATDREFVVDSISALLGTQLHAFVEVRENQLAEVAESLAVTFPQSMNGEKRKDILSYIYAEDISPAQQTEQLRQVLTIVADKVLAGNIVQQVLRLRKAAPLLTTNLSWRQLLSTSKGFAEADFAEITQIYSLPGSVEVRTDGNYWLPKAESLPTLAAWLDGEASAIPRENITIEVLNGCGITGLANQVAQLLQNEGFSVTRITNADNFDYTVSQVISRTSDSGPAKDVALLIPNAQLLTADTPGADVLVTVIIGKNYNNSE